MDPQLGTEPNVDYMTTPLGALPDASTLNTTFLEELCGHSSGRTLTSTQLRRAETLFADYYAARCQEFLSDGKIHISVRTNGDVKQIVRRIVSGETREAILRNTSGGDAVASTTLDLCASLVVMAEIGSHDFRISARENIPWKSGSLQDSLRLYFTRETPLDVDGTRLSKIFTARNIARIGGIHIRWTDNLADHLRLADDDKTVFIFRHASFLKFQRSLENPVLPLNTIAETLRTFALLFPQNDPKTRAWLEFQKKRGLKIDGSVNECGSTRAHERVFDSFDIWHTRLVILKQAFDDAQPQDLTQWLWDRRDGAQWYTFWIAFFVFLLTLFFGLVQSIEGAIQVYYAVQDHASKNP